MKVEGGEKVEVSGEGGCGGKNPGIVQVLLLTKIILLWGVWAPVLVPWDQPLGVHDQDGDLCAPPRKFSIMFFFYFFKFII